MSLVCLSHFVNIYSRTSGVDLTGVYCMTMVAAPTFMMISGVVLGYFHVLKGSVFQSVIREFFERGLFILLIARLLICLAFVPLSGGFVESLKYVYITDAVGVNLIFGPTIVRQLGTLPRLMLAFACWVASWSLLVAWSPESFGWEFVKETMFGDWEYSYFHAANYAFPIVPWFGLYLVGTCVGETLGKHSLSGDTNAAAKYCAGMGLIGVTSSMLVKFIFLAGKKYSLSSVFGLVLTYALTSPTQKAPPSVPYYLFYGGCGMLMLGGFIVLKDSHPLRFGSHWAALIGRNSLLVFVAQYYVYNVLLLGMNLPYSASWPFYFLASLICLFGVARVGDAWKLTKFFRLPVVSRWSASFCGRRSLLRATPK